MKRRPGLVQGIVARVRRTCAARVQRVKDERLEEMIDAGLARACAHGFTTEWSLAEFVALMFEVAPNFDEHPTVRALLADTARSADARLDRVSQVLTPDIRREARELHDDAAFFPARRPAEARAELPTVRLESPR